jgi:hypothetical protein
MRSILLLTVNLCVWHKSNVHYHEVNVPEYPLFQYQPMNWLCQQIGVDKLYKIEILHVHYAIPHAYAGYMAKQMLKDRD